MANRFSRRARVIIVVAAQRGSERLRLRKKPPFRQSRAAFTMVWALNFAYLFLAGIRADTLATWPFRASPDLDHRCGETWSQECWAKLLDLGYLFPNPIQYITCNHVNTSFENDEATGFYQIMVSRNGFHTK
jgi:hypothetical protein